MDCRNFSNDLAITAGMASINHYRAIGPLLGRVGEFGHTRRFRTFLWADRGSFLAHQVGRDRARTRGGRGRFLSGPTPSPSDPKPLQQEPSALTGWPIPYIDFVTVLSHGYRKRAGCGL